MIGKIAASVLGFAAAAFIAGGAAAQEDYPSKPVEFIVPWSPGGGSDVLMRIIANNVEPYLGQPMAVINMPGVSGTVGLREAAARAADGYTIAQIHEGLLIANQVGMTEQNWDSFDPIALMTSSPQFVVVNADQPYETFEEFIEYARENPGSIRFGVTLGGVPHLHAAMIEEAFDVEFSYVGYEGTGERIRALVGGNLDAAIGDIASSQQFVENGDLRFLAHGYSERLDQAPDVPTMEEVGAPMELLITRGIVMPKGSPEAARNTMEQALRELSEDPKFVEQTGNAGAEVQFRGQEDYTSYLSDLGATIERLADRLAP